jgi:hypothetical protein
MVVVLVVVVVDVEVIVEVEVDVIVLVSVTVEVEVEVDVVVVVVVVVPPLLVTEKKARADIDRMIEIRPSPMTSLLEEGKFIGFLVGVLLHVGE